MKSAEGVFEHIPNEPEIRFILRLILLRPFPLRFLLIIFDYFLSGAEYFVAGSRVPAQRLNFTLSFE
jgi:hypothetical protein